jgi:hypothetical protein
MDTLWYISERVSVWYMYGLCIGSNYVTYAVVVVGMAIGMTSPLHFWFHHACEFVHRERRERYELIFSTVVLSMGIGAVVYFGLPEILIPFEFFDSCERFVPDKKWKV